MNKPRRKIAIVSTVPFALQVFMRAHIQKLAQEYDVTLITSGGKDELNGLLVEHVRAVSVGFSRQISIVNDLRCLFRLVKLFRVERFDVVHSLMPKTGLLAMLAARLDRVPNRVHVFTGQVWANKSGVRRVILKLMDRLIVLCATDLLTDSVSQRQFLISQNVVTPEKITVLANGSICGVDLERFSFDQDRRDALRVHLRIPHDAIVVLFLGRVNVEKGVSDLVEVFQAVQRQIPKIHLLVVGPDEGKLDQSLLEMAQSYSTHYHRVGLTDQPQDYMSCADLFCLPSYREGFGSVVVEAAAVGLPAVASRIYGLIDAVEDGHTGILFEAKNMQQLHDALVVMAKNGALRQTMSIQAKQRARQLFSQDLVTDAMVRFYEQMLTTPSEQSK